MICYVMLCYVMLCYVMLCYVMLCYVMLCYVMFYSLIYAVRPSTEKNTSIPKKYGDAVYMSPTEH